MLFKIIIIQKWIAKHLNTNNKPYSGNLNVYKESIKSIYNKRVAFLNQYVKSNNIQSKLFIDTIKTNLKHEYLFSLINPVNIKSRREEHYFNEFDGLTTIIQKETTKNSEVIFDLSNYFGEIYIEEFKDVIALNLKIISTNTEGIFSRFKTFSLFKRKVFSGKKIYPKKLQW